MSYTKGTKVSIKKLLLDVLRSLYLKEGPVKTLLVAFLAIMLQVRHPNFTNDCNDYQEKFFNVFPRR